jgi:hypothetical protein
MYMKKGKGDRTRTYVRSLVFVYSPIPGRVVVHTNTCLSFAVLSHRVKLDSTLHTMCNTVCSSHVIEFILSQFSLVYVDE